MNLFSLADLSPEAKQWVSLPVAMRLIEERRLRPPFEGLAKIVCPNPEDGIEVM
jgi:hypothetical protein